MIGKEKTTCMLNGELFFYNKVLKFLVNDGSADWDAQEPLCRLTCDEPMKIKNGDYICSESGSVGSACNYSQGFQTYSKRQNFRIIKTLHKVVMRASNYGVTKLFHAL